LKALCVPKTSGDEVRSPGFVLDAQPPAQPQAVYRMARDLISPVAEPSSMIDAL
jgi:hypothetical protein